MCARWFRRNQAIPAVGIESNGPQAAKSHCDFSRASRHRGFRTRPPQWSPAGRQISAVTPIRENVISSISSNGKVEPIAPSVVRAQLDTFIERISVVEGQPVKKASFSSS